MGTLATHELGFLVQGIMPIFCDDQVATFRNNNLTFRDCTKLVKINYRGICNIILNGLIITPLVSATNLHTNILQRR